MTLDTVIRQTHRWVSIVFTLAALANIGALALGFGGEGQEVLAMTLGMSALLPLVIMLLTGLYLFVLPYVGKARSRAAG